MKRQENSVMTSLKELQRIEVDRVSEDQRARDEAALQQRIKQLEAERNRLAEDREKAAQRAREIAAREQTFSDEMNRLRQETKQQALRFEQRLAREVANAVHVTPPAPVAASPSARRGVFVAPILLAVALGVMALWQSVSGEQRQSEIRSEMHALAGKLATANGVIEIQRGDIAHTEDKLSAVLRKLDTLESSVRTSKGPAGVQKDPKSGGRKGGRGGRGGRGSDRDSDRDNDRSNDDDKIANDCAKSGDPLCGIAPGTGAR